MVMVKHQSIDPKRPMTENEVDAAHGQAKEDKGEDIRSRGMFLSTSKNKEPSKQGMGQALPPPVASTSSVTATNRTLLPPELATSTHHEANEEYDKTLFYLWTRCEQERQVHRLSADYFSFRHFWFLFIPTSMLTMTASILSFISTTDMLPQGTRTTLSLIVGVLAILSTFAQVLNDQLKWSIKAEMHKSASVDLKKIVDDLDFQQNTPFLDDVKVKVAEYYKMYSQISQSVCKFDPPLEITQAFSALDTRLTIQMKEPEYQKYSRQDKHELYVAVGSELYCNISRHWLWPWKLPVVDHVLKSAICKVLKLDDGKPEAAKDRKGKNTAVMPMTQEPVEQVQVPL